MLTQAALAELRATFGDRVWIAGPVLAEHAQGESMVTAGLPWA